jgi:hypothetical protein
MTRDRLEFEKLYPAGAGPVRMPAGLTDRITAAAVRDYRVRKITRRAGWTAAAAGVLVAAWFAIPSAHRETDRPVARMIDPFREADAAFATLSRSAADRVTSTVPTLPVTTGLIPPIEPVPAAPKLAALPAFEPLTDTATRAVGRFFRDLGAITKAGS